MKRSLISFFALLTTFSAFAQAGLGHGEAVVNPTTNPTQAKKHCPHCGISMGNITYPWQHETWCPYYRSNGSGGGSSSSSSSVTSAAMGVGAAVLGSAISNLITAAMDHSSGDNNYYKNDGFAQQLSFKTQYYSDDDHTCVVLRDPKTGKKGIWHNAYVFNHKRDPQPTSGFWILKPEYEQIYMDLFMSHPYAVTVKEVKKKGETVPEWQVYEFGLGSMCYKGHATIISPYPASDVEFSFKAGKIMLQKRDADGKAVWGLYKVARAGSDEIKKRPITLQEMAVPQLDSIQFYAGQSIIWKDGLCGVIDDNGKQLIPIRYKDVGTVVGKKKLAWAVDEDGNCGLINTKGEVILPFVHSSMHVDEYGVSARRDGEDRYFVLLADGSRTDAVYDDVTFTKDGYVFERNGLYGFANNQGEKVLESEFESIQIVDHDPELVKFTKVNDDYVGKKMFFVKKDGKWGVKHWTDGSYILEPIVLDRNKVLYYLGTLKTYDFKMMERDQRDYYSHFKGEFETQAQFEARRFDPVANEDYVQKQMADFPQQFLRAQLNQALKYNTGMTINWHDYDAEREAFPFSSNLSALPIYYLSVPIGEGPAFRQALSSLRTKDLLQTVKVFIYQHFAQIAEMDIALPDGKTYHYVNPGLEGYTGPIVHYSDLF
ncbi:MAG: WG repeat-containing protein [Bacteroidales bacterium]|nr:WG repeat-containing protein [Bacteroidales bacterium]